MSTRDDLLSLADEIRADLVEQIADLKDVSEEVRQIALEAGDVAARAVIERLEGRDTDLIERALRMAFRALGVAVTIEVTTQIRRVMAATVRRVAELASTLLTRA